MRGPSVRVMIEVSLCTKSAPWEAESAASATVAATSTMEATVVVTVGFVLVATSVTSVVAVGLATSASSLAAAASCLAVSTVVVVVAMIVGGASALVICLLQIRLNILLCNKHIFEISFALCLHSVSCNRDTITVCGKNWEQ